MKLHISLYGSEKSNFLRSESKWNLFGKLTQTSSSLKSEIWAPQVPCSRAANSRNLSGLCVLSKSMKFCWDVVLCIIIKMWCSAKLNSWKIMIYASLNQLCMLAFISFLGRKKWLKIFISDEQKWIHRHKERKERSKMSYCTTSRVSWKWNYRGLTFMFEEAFCVLRMHNAYLSFLIGLYLVTHVSSKDGKGVIFLIFDSSFMWREQFCPGRTFNFDDFYFIGKP